MNTFRYIIISIALLCLVGCKTVRPIQIVWENPLKPITYPVHFEQHDNGLFIDKESSINLLKNIDGIDAYTEKLEVLVKEMKTYYGAK